MADLRSPERMWEYFPLFLCLLSRGNAVKMSTDIRRNTHAHMHAHTHAQDWDFSWWDKGVGAVGSQKVHETQDIRDKSLEAQCEFHAHAQRGMH